MQKYLIIHDRWEFICSRILRVAMAVDGYAFLGVMKQFHQCLFQGGHQEKGQVVLPWEPDLILNCLQRQMRETPGHAF